MVMMERNLMRVMIILYAAVLLGGAGTMWMSAPPAAQPVCCTFAR
jgi:cell division septal protein FtsQ